ncbi:MAG: tyrosine-type recombinase/integrase [Alphaproteobacteria bacterium]
MPRQTNKLAARFVASHKMPGKYPDGGGLFLQVTGEGAKSWLYRFVSPTVQKRNKAGVPQFRDSGKPEMQVRWMGLGALSDLSLAEARLKRVELRKMVFEGTDPIEARKQERTARIADSTATRSFEWCAAQYLKSRSGTWKNVKHARQWASTLATYVYPVLGALPIGSVETAHVLEVLEPIWPTKTETASRVRGRIESVIDWAIARGIRSGPNPARWRGHLDKILPKPNMVARVQHLPALRYQEAPTFMQALRGIDSISARALEFLILTCCRTSEVTGAAWNEIDTSAALWDVPGVRMKSGNPHRVPLSKRALEILKRMEAVRCSEYIFPGGRENSPLSDMAMSKVVKQLRSTGQFSSDDFTVHGFRSTFKDWVSERTRHSNEVTEMALAHTISNKVEAAYRRGDLFEKRRRVMADWADYLDSAGISGEVVSIRGLDR